MLRTLADLFDAMETLSDQLYQSRLAALRACRPLVHCITNDVVQEMTANVLLAAGASPAMIVAPEEAADFAAVASVVLINVGTLRADLVRAMRLAIESAKAHDKPWVLDPVAAGLLPWRDAQLAELLRFGPAAIRGNGSEIRALAGLGSGGKGVDSTEGSEAALEAAGHLARLHGCVVCVTGATDFITDGERVLSVGGGSETATRVVGTGCSLSALAAAFIASSPGQRTEAVAAACMMAKKAAEAAAAQAQGPGSFRTAYIDALSR